MSVLRRPVETTGQRSRGDGHGHGQSRDKEFTGGVGSRVGSSLSISKKHNQSTFKWGFIFFDLFGMSRTHLDTADRILAVRYLGFLGAQCSIHSDDLFDTVFKVILRSSLMPELRPFGFDTNSTILSLPCYFYFCRFS